MKFWNWVRNDENGESELFLYGAIASESWFHDDVTPEQFREELAQHPGNVTVWINSPGGDCFAASQIYTMLRNHGGKITVKIDGIAASAASVVAMAGDETLIAPTGMLMVHNPATIAMGNKSDMEQAIKVLDEVKESIINAYQTKSNLSRAKIAKMMDEETWMNARKANALGFVDGILFQEAEQPDETPEEPENMLYSPVQMQQTVLRKVSASAEPVDGIPVEQFYKRLELLRTF